MSYADDVFAVLKNLKSLETLLSLIELYEKGTGAKLNKSKTEAMWLGAWRSRSDEPLGLTWVKKMKILGVFFGTIPVEQDNWMPKINKLEKALHLWRMRSLSLLGKALVINILGFSKLLYLAKVLIGPRGFSRELIQLFGRFYGAAEWRLWPVILSTLRLKMEELIS